MLSGANSRKGSRALPSRCLIADSSSIVISFGLPPLAPLADIVSPPGSRLLRKLAFPPRLAFCRIDGLRIRPVPSQQGQMASASRW